MIHFLFIETGLGWVYLAVFFVTAVVSFCNAVLDSGDTAKWGARVFLTSPVWIIWPILGLVLLAKALIETAGWWPKKKEVEK